MQWAVVVLPAFAMLGLIGPTTAGALMLTTGMLTRGGQGPLGLVVA